MLRVLMTSLIAAQLVVPVGAEELVLPVEDWAAIGNGSGETRVLLHVDELPEGDRLALMHAELRLPVVGAAVSRVYDLRAYPLTRSWSAGSVDWEEDWEQPGGDYREDLFGRCQLDLSRGAQEIVFDVRPAVLAMMDGEFVENGFLLTVARQDGEGIQSEDLSRLEETASGTLTLRFRRVGRKPPLGN